MKRKVVAITGGIGSGKSEVSSILRSRGYMTISCDELATEVSFRPHVIEEVRKLLGDKFVTHNQLNRKAIRERVFSNEETLRKYNAIFFNAVKNLLNERLQNEQGIVFVEIPVFDAFDFQWDAVWQIEADVETRIDRAMKRDNATRDNLEEIIARQYVCKSYTLKINNCGSLNDLQMEVDKAIKTLK